MIQMGSDVIPHDALPVLDWALVYTGGSALSAAESGLGILFFHRVSIQIPDDISEWKVALNLWTLEVKPILS